jgi:protein-S-isoprenylcysteine O-methyltransferase Ste14
MTKAEDPQDPAADSESPRGTDAGAFSNRMGVAVPSSLPQETETKAGPSNPRLNDTEAAVAGLIAVVLFVLAGSVVGVPGSSEPQTAGAIAGGLIGLALVILSWTWRR